VITDRAPSSKQAAPARTQILLSPPHMSGNEERYVADAFRSNWIAPLGPHVDGFEADLKHIVGSSHAVALSSGTAAIHLALIVLGIGPGDEVLVSTFTFSASVNPIRYVGATPVFIDSERTSWNMDPNLLEQALRERARAGRLPKAVLVVDLYGQTADMAAITEICDRHGVPLVEDAAEALGASHGKKSAGTFGALGIFSFNGNKIITTSGGGMLVGENREHIELARKLATQAREPQPYYEHTLIGYNYRLSNLLAAVGRGQLEVLEDRVRARRAHFEAYASALGDIGGVEFSPEAPWGRSNRWLTCITLDAGLRTDASGLIAALADEGIEARRLWKPMHLQPVFAEFESLGGGVSEDLFARGLCLPSGSSMSADDRQRVIEIVRRELV
jgi:pyridoxal phosphate-dependent aminotransferase EpsN